MDFSLSDEELRFVRELRDYFDGLELPPDVDMRYGYDDEAASSRSELIQKLARDGWLGIGWPREYGGRGGGPVEQWLYQEEMAWRRLPNRSPSLAMIGPTLIRLGTEEQKRAFLPGILQGSIEFALGYSEPDAGTDLASLSTRAVREGSDYVVNGVKIWTTYANFATHLWLAVRTNVAAEKHRGLSILVVPTASTGITIRPIRVQSDLSTNQVFLDDVRVPISNRVGGEDEGWAVIMTALSFERFYLFSELARDFDDLLALCKEQTVSGRPVIAHEGVRHELARIAVAIELGRLLGTRNVDMIARGRVPRAEVSMVKIWISELRTRLANVGIGILGEMGQLRRGSSGAVAAGVFEWLYRFAPAPKFGGGANEVQRDIIAQGLGLPRHPVRERPVQ